MCERELFAQCETTQVRSEGKGATLFGYTSLYGSVPGGQAEYLRVPQAQFGPIKIPDGTPDEQFLFLSDVLPTAWQAVRVRRRAAAAARWPCSGSARSARCACASPGTWAPGASSASTRCPSGSRSPRATAPRPLDLSAVDDISATLLDLVDGRGPDSTIDAVGMEAHGGAPGQQDRLVRAEGDRACCPTPSRRRSPTRSPSTASTRCSARSRACGAAARCRSAASTAARSIRCR